MKLRVAYLLQHNGLELRAQQAIQVHSQSIVKAISSLDHDIKLVSLQGRRLLLINGHSLRQNDLNGSEGEFRYANRLPVRVSESVVRRAQTYLGLPYLALLDSLRFRDGLVTSVSDVDVFHERYEPFHTGGTWAAKRLEIPLVLEVNADMLSEWEYQGKGVTGTRLAYARWATEQQFAGAGRIMVVSDELREHLHRKWEVPYEKLIVLPNGADTDVFRPLPPDETIRLQYGLPPSPIVMFVGGFYKWHNPLLLIESFSILHAEHPDASLVLVGDGPLAGEVRNFAARRGVSSNVRFLGKVQHAEIPGLLSLADVAVAPFNQFPPGLGGSALKLFEYMACGKAIVTSASGQVVDIVKDGDTARIVPVGDATAFARAMCELLSNEDLRQHLGSRARDEVVAKHTWLQRGERLVDLYAELSAARRSSPLVQEV